MLSSYSEQASLLTLPGLRAGPLPAPDGSIVTADRHHLLGLHSGTLATSGGGSPVFGTVTYAKGSPATDTVLTIPSHVVLPGQDLLVIAHPYDYPHTQFISCVWDVGAGEALTAMNTPVTGGTHVFHVATPTPGTQDIILTANTNRWLVAVAISLSGFDFTNVLVFRDAGGFNGTIGPTSVPTSAGTYLIDFAMAENATPGWVEGASQTVLGTPLTGGGTLPNNAASSYKVATGASTSMTWTIADSFWTHTILYNIVPSGGGGGGGGGGGPLDGIDPVLSVLPGPQVFSNIEEPADGTILDGAADRALERLSDPTLYYGGNKPGRITALPAIRRAYQTFSGGAQLSSWRTVHDDTDRYYRSQHGTQTWLHKKIAHYAISHPDRLNLQEPYRFAAGIIVDHGAVDDFGYEFVVEGMLGRQSSKKLQERRVPHAVLTPSLLPSLAGRHDSGWAPPLLYGRLSDEDDAAPAGIVPCEYVATVNLQAQFGGVDEDALILVLAGHAISDLENLYYNLPDDPTRIVVPGGSYGTHVYAPYQPNWTDVIPSGDVYVDFAGFRLTIIAVPIAAIGGDLAQAIIDGRVRITANLVGVEDVGDGTGVPIHNPALIVEHFWSNFVERTYVGGNWATTMPPFGAYSLFSQSALAAARDYAANLIPGGLLGAILIGRDGRQEPLFEVLQRMVRSWDLDVGDDRHGRILVDHEDFTATPVATFTAQQHITGLRWRIDRQAYANTIRFRWGPRYAPPTGPTAAPSPGEPLPEHAIPIYSPWRSGLLELRSDTAIARNNGVPVYLDLDLDGVQDQLTAETVAIRTFARALGPNLEGPIVMDLVTDWHGAGLVIGQEVDLGSTIAVTHPEGFGANGFVAQPFRVREVITDGLPGVMTLVCRLQPTNLDLPL